MILYGLKTCGNCRKALKSCPDMEFVDLRRQGVPTAILIKALGLFGAKLVNKRSATWRELSAQDRARAPIELLETYPALMKRPLIVDGGKMCLGWNPQICAAPDP